MILFLKSSSSRRVVNEDYGSNINYKDYTYKGSFEKNVDETLRTLLTVWRKSLLVNCSGFTVIDCKGNLVFRVDNYGSRPSEIVLMDGCGKSLLTMRRHKTMRLVDDWLVYEGEACDQAIKPRHKKQPIGYVKKNVSILQTHSNVLASVYMGKSSKTPTFIIEGSYPQRSCKIVEKSSKTIVAEIKRKEATNGSASFGSDVFQLVVVPGFDTGFAMTLVLLLDQMYS